MCLYPEEVEHTHPLEFTFFEDVWGVTDWTVSSVKLFSDMWLMGLYPFVNDATLPVGHMRKYTGLKCNADVDLGMRLNVYILILNLHTYLYHS